MKIGTFDKILGSLGLRIGRNSMSETFCRFHLEKEKLYVFLVMAVQSGGYQFMKSESCDPFSQGNECNLISGFNNRLGLPI